jgi:hypothetical protein
LSGSAGAIMSTAAMGDGDVAGEYNGHRGDALSERTA